MTFNSVQDFIDNVPAAVATAADSPVFTPEQYYLLGFVQDSWRATSKLSLELGLRYDFYSVVREANNLSKPFFIEENHFAPSDADFYNPDKNNFSPRLSASYQLTDKTAIRGGFGLFYGSGQFEDRIQPMENYVDRSRLQASDVPNNGLQYPLPANLNTLLSIRGYTHERPDE